MHTHRSTLLITLALFCVLAIGPPHATAQSVSLGYVSADGGTAPTYFNPGVTPNSGEPDAGGSGPMPQAHNSMTQARHSDSAPAPQSSGRYMAIALRWARVFWMARFLGLTP